MNNLSNKRFFKLTVLSFHSRNGKNYLWLCQCDCGNTCFKSTGHLNSGSAKSCGCLKRGAKTTHGLIRTPEYKSWQSMKSRCNNENDPSYKHYGGRGIKVCDRWMKSFENFLSDIGRKPTSNHSLDRIDFNRDYEPSNCRWATDFEQNNNKRANKKILVDGHIVTVSQAAKMKGLEYHVLHSRLYKYGIELNISLNTEVRLGGEPIKLRQKAL